MKKLAVSLIVVISAITIVGLTQNSAGAQSTVGDCNNLYPPTQPALDEQRQACISRVTTNEGGNSQFNLCGERNTSFLGIFPTWDKYLSPAAGDCSVGFSNINDVWKIGLAIFEILLRLSGIIAVAMIMFGGFSYIFSQGNPQTITQARQTLTWAIIGLIIAALSTTIVNLIGRALSGDPPV